VTLQQMLPLYQGLTAQTYSTIKSRSCCCVGEAEAAAMLSALGAASTMFTACCGFMTFGQSLRHVNNLCTTVTTHGCNNPNFSFVNCFLANSQMYQNLLIIATIRFPNYNAIIISPLQMLSVGVVRQTTLKITNATNVV
jgi:hypothetical protein